MFKKVKDKEKRAKLIEGLKAIVTGTQTHGSILVPKTFVDDLLKAEPTFVKTQGEPDFAGQIAVFATSEGAAAAGASVPSAGAADAAAPEAKPTFVLETGYAVPVSKRGGGLKADIYPFKEMAVGTSFFVAATEAKPNPAKGLQSTVSSANKRYLAAFPATTGKDKKAHPKAGQPTGMDGRKFTVRPVEEPGKGKGARVYRVA